MITKVGQVGKSIERLSYRDFRVERKGFLTTLSYQLEGVGRRFDIMDRGQAVSVMPVDFRTRELYMLSEIRSNKPFGTLESGRAWIRKVTRDGCMTAEEAYEIPVADARMYEMCAGMIDVDKATGEFLETSRAAAVRELREETGLVIGEDRLHHVVTGFPSVGGSCEMIHAFIADLPEGHFAARVTPPGDGNEAMDVYLMSWDDAFALMREGKIEATTTGLLLRELKIMELEGRAAPR